MKYLFFFLITKIRYEQTLESDENMTWPPWPPSPPSGPVIEEIYFLVYILLASYTKLFNYGVPSFFPSF